MHKLFVNMLVVTTILAVGTRVQARHLQGAPTGAVLYTAPYTIMKKLNGTSISTDFRLSSSSALPTTWR